MNFDIFDSFGNYIGYGKENPSGRGSGGCIISLVISLVMIVSLIVAPVYFWYAYFFDITLLNEEEAALPMITALATNSLIINGLIGLVFILLIKFNSIKPMVQWILLTWMPCTMMLIILHINGSGSENLIGLVVIALIMSELPSLIVTIISRLFIQKKSMQKAKEST